MNTTIRNITLIGMPGSGKSSVGVVAAKMLNFNFIDSDLLIQRQEGKTLSQIIEEKGVAAFHEIENKVNSSIHAEETVIAPGGSVIYGKEAMAHLKSISTVVYLKISFDELQNRLGDLKNRGVTMQEGQTLKDLYDERIPYYESYADIIVEEDGLALDKTAAKILELLHI